MQFPRVMSVVSDRQPRVVCDHVRMNGQDSFGVRLYPGNLYNRTGNADVSPFQQLIINRGSLVPALLTPAPDNNGFRIRISGISYGRRFSTPVWDTSLAPRFA